MEKIAYSVSELGKALGIGRNNAYALIHREGFPAVRIGGRVIVPVKELEEWLRKNTLSEAEGNQR
ncbi:MAG: helix-turn-helix domain-containing protein [Clostridia bacterium]|nr:helix-turn-helix domain-containing protein [Clostridia bacterium]MBR4442562.1 helix-turn-helix domain-containing protein [Clostridia bacterium]